MIINKYLQKAHKPSSNLIEYKSTLLIQGRIGVKALANGRIEVRQFNAIKHFFKRFLKKKKGRIFYRLFPEFFVTKKSLGNARMGKGKSALDRLMFFVKRGQVIFEINYKKNISELNILFLLAQCEHKLPLKVKIFKLQY